MSQDFIIEYAGEPVRFVNGNAELVAEELATPYSTAAMALADAKKFKLNLDHVRVVNLRERNLK